MIVIYFHFFWTFFYYKSLSFGSSVRLNRRKKKKLKIITINDFFSNGRISKLKVLMNELIYLLINFFLFIIFVTQGIWVWLKWR